MLTNADITIYNRVYDPTERLAIWHRTVIHDVSFYADRKVVEKNGQDAANVYRVRIPEISPDSKYVTPSEYTGADGTWTIQNGDHVVEGICLVDIKTPSDITAEHAFCVTSWSDNRRGGLPHWRIGGA